jgi:hypothetical protein
MPRQAMPNFAADTDRSLHDFVRWLQERLAASGLRCNMNAPAAATFPISFKHRATDRRDLFRVFAARCHSDRIHAAFRKAAQGRVTVVHRGIDIVGRNIPVAIGIMALGEFAGGFLHPVAPNKFLMPFRVVQLSRLIAWRTALPQTSLPCRLGENDAWIAGTTLQTGAQI